MTMPRPNPSFLMGPAPLERPAPRRQGRSRSGRRLIPLLLLLCLLPLLHACGGDDPVDELRDVDMEEPDALPPEPLEGLQLNVAMERLEYAPGDAIPVSLQISNRSEETRTLSFRTTQRYDLVLLTDQGEVLARWSEDQVFGQALGEEVLEGDSDGPVWDVEWEAPETPGSYRLEAVILPAEGELRMGVPIEVTEG